MVQNVFLVWLDNNIDNTSADCRNTINQLRCAVNTINTFTDGEECIQFIENITDNKACMIISGALGKDIVPRVHSMSQVDSIFIFCDNKNYHEQWAKEWSKIKGVFTEISPICQALKKTAQQCEQNAIPMSFVITSGDESQKKLDQLEPSFMYTQILKEILLTIKFNEKHIAEFLNYCRDVLTENKNENELKNVDKLQSKYHDETPIWWYTYECFLYPMLNRALRVMNVDLIIKMGFFLNDLHRHIEQLHLKQFTDQNSNTSFIVYRGQGISTTEFEQMTKTKGGLISFNNFLSTSKNRDISFNFARSALCNPDLVGILFVMAIEPSQSTASFASVTDVSCCGDEEEEVLFAMHTVFRIRDITPMSEHHQLFQVELTLTNDNDEDLRQLTDRIREENFPDNEGWYRLGSVLLKMGQFEKAQQVYESLLEQATQEGVKGNIYDRLGFANYKKGNYKKAIVFYQKSLKIYHKTLPSTHSNLAVSYNNIGLVYDSMGKYSKALLSYQKALEIDLKILPPNLSDLATSYSNIGLVYKNMGKYSKALSYYEKAFEIWQKALPANHPDLATSYNNIGMVYDNMGQYSKALSYYEKAFEIRQKTLPANHPDLATSYNNIGVVYDNVGEYSKALSYYEKAFEIRQKTLPANHPNLATSYNNIGTVYYNMGEYSKALSYYERALNILQRSVPLNHPHLQSVRKSIEIVTKKL
jgi:tetratricopeptide (TPR) repeat protein